jgi:hypothetical protein
MEDSNQSESLNAPSGITHIAVSRRPGQSQYETPDTIPSNIVTGYKYRYDINATSLISDRAVALYMQRFNDDLSLMQFDWTPSNDRNVSGCNDINEHNVSLIMYEGSSVIPRQQKSQLAPLLQIGEYKFKIKDEKLTKSDWDLNMMRHHTNDTVHFEQIDDCVKDDNDINIISNGRVGCRTDNDISYANNTYFPLYLRTYPYDIDIGGLNIGAGPNLNSAMVYMNTLDETADYPDGYKNTGDQNMSYNIQGSIKVAGYNGADISNFVKGCYSDGLFLSVQATPYVDVSSNTLRSDIVLYNTSSPSHTHPTIQGSWSKDATNTLGINISANEFNKTNVGSLTLDLGYNFDRSISSPMNPIYVNFKDLNVTDAAQPTTLYVELDKYHKIYGDKDSVDQNITFVYGRAKANKFFYDDIASNSVETPVSIVAYCDLGLIECQNRGLANIASGLLSDAQSNENNWWFVQQHSISSGDGNVFLLGSVNPANPSAINILNGIDTSVTVTNTGSTPNIEDINLSTNTNRWLIYNKDLNAIPYPFYRVRFIGTSGTSGWTGHGKTGHVVGDDINSKKTKRLEW